MGLLNCIMFNTSPSFPSILAIDAIALSDGCKPSRSNLSSVIIFFYVPIYSHFTPDYRRLSDI